MNILNLFIWNMFFHVYLQINEINEERQNQIIWHRIKPKNYILEFSINLRKLILFFNISLSEILPNWLS